MHAADLEQPHQCPCLIDARNVNDRDCPVHLQESVAVPIRMDSACQRFLQQQC